MDRISRTSDDDGAGCECGRQSGDAVRLGAHPSEGRAAALVCRGRGRPASETAGGAQGSLKLRKVAIAVSQFDRSYDAHDSNSNDNEDVEDDVDGLATVVVVVVVVVVVGEVPCCASWKRLSATPRWRGL